MIKKLLLLSIFLTFGILFGQVPHGSIHVDVTKILNNESLILLKNKKSLDSVLLKNDISIFPSYAAVSKKIDSLSIDYFIDPKLIMFEKKYLEDIDKNIIGLYDGWVNFSFFDYTYYVTKIRRGSEDMVIYFHINNICNPFSNNGYMLNTNIYYDNLEFRTGTYFICLKNEELNNDGLPKYYNIGNSNNYIMIKNETVAINKISEKVVLPEDLPKFYKNKDLKRSEAIEKILSVFDNK